MRIYLQLPALDGKSTRFCHLHLQEDLINGWTLVKEQGQQGGAGKLQRFHFETHDQAIDALIQAKDQAVKKGFKIVFAQGEPPQ